MARRKTKAPQKRRHPKAGQRTASKLASVSARLKLEDLVMRLEAVVLRLEQMEAHTEDLDDGSDRPTIDMSGAVPLAIGAKK